VLDLLGAAFPQPTPSGDGWQPPSDPTPALIALVFLCGVPAFLLFMLGLGNIIDWLDHRERLKRGRRPK
jgi:hypothetical protein